VKHKIEAYNDYIAKCLTGITYVVTHFFTFIDTSGHQYLLRDHSLDVAESATCHSATSFAQNLAPPSTIRNSRRPVVRGSSYLFLHPVTTQPSAVTSLS